jgi:hypothetical protein
MNDAKCAKLLALLEAYAVAYDLHHMPDLKVVELMDDLRPSSPTPPTDMRLDTIKEQR